MVPVTIIRYVLVMLMVVMVMVMLMVMMVIRLIDDAYIVAGSVRVPYEGSSCSVLNTLAHSTHSSICFSSLSLFSLFL